MRSVKQNEYETIVEYTIKSNSVLYAEGKPGIGKSQIVAQISKDMNRRLIDIRASLIGEGDLLTKIATEDRSKLVEVVSDILPREENTVLLFDEFRHAHRDIRRMFYQLILDRRLGSNYKLPVNTAIIVLSNNTNDVDTEELENALFDRMIMRVNVEGDFEVWKQYAYNKGIREEIIAFLQLFKEYFILYGAEDRLEMSPRRWEMVSKHWDMRKYIMSDIISGMFEEFIQSIMTFKDVEAYLDGKKKISGELDFQYKLATAILMSNNEKIYKKVILGDRILSSEVDIFLLLGCMRKLTGKLEIVEAFRELDSDCKKKLIDVRLKDYEWMFKK